EIGELATTFNQMTNDLQAERTALQRANRELDEQLKAVSQLERYNDRILSSMSNGLVTLNLDGRIVRWNDMAARITGYTTGDVEGKLCQEVFATNQAFVRVLMEALHNR